MSTTTLSELQADQQQYVLNTYAPKTVLVRGQGCYVWDIEGNRYLDFGMGISVCNLGHCHPAITAAIQKQSQKLVHCSNIYINENQPRLAAELIKRSFPGKVFFCNSGAEANEGQIKFARLWGSKHGGKYEIICAQHSFHGRTLATLAATGKMKIREGFQPDMPGFVFAEYNNVKAFEEAITDKTAAILIEPVQGEGGIQPATLEFMQGLRKLCDKHKILLMLDEVQCGMGRTGKLFAHQNFDIIPDSMSIAKAIANGFPMGGFIVRNPYSEVFTPGSHGSTFGGTPLGSAIALAVLETMDHEKVLDNVQVASVDFWNRLVQLQAHHSIVANFRSLGLMIGIDVGKFQKEVAQECMKRKLVVLTAGEHDVRLLPCLKITPEEIEYGMKILDEAITAVEATLS
ncbi:MAG: aspartate aminotransferase family protein [Lentisphaeria bacterium]